MDFNEFLQAEGELTQVLPYFGGFRVNDESMEYRVKDPPKKCGWYLFKVVGRRAEVLESVEVPDLFHYVERGVLLTRTGYVVNNRVLLYHLTEFGPNTITQNRLFGLTEELERFTPVKAVVWFGGELIYLQEEFGTEAEELVRVAYLDRGGLEGIKGVTPLLTHVFVAEGLIRAERERKQAEREKKQKEGALKATLEGRLKFALGHMGAELLDYRKGNSGLVVMYRFLGRKFECVVDPNTLQVLDSGICLTDHATGRKGDNSLTLESMPSVVKEAIDRQKLVVWRHVDEREDDWEDGDDGEEEEDW